MGVIQHVWPWDSQPQEAVQPAQRWVNRGLVYADLPSSSIDLRTGAPLTITGTQVRPEVWGLTRGFGSSLGAGTTDRIITPLRTQSTLRTYVWWCKLNGSGGGNFGRVFDHPISGTTSAELIYISSSLCEYARSRTGSNTVCNWNTSSLPLGVGKPGARMILEYDSSSTVNQPRLWVNGKEYTRSSFSTGSGSVQVSTQPYCIGNRAADNARVFDGLISDFAVFDALLSEEEKQELNNPGALWSARRIYIPTAAAATALPTLSLPTAVDITATSFRPRVTYAY